VLKKIERGNNLFGRNGVERCAECRGRRRRYRDSIETWLMIAVYIRQSLASMSRLSGAGSQKSMLQIAGAQDGVEIRAITSATNSDRCRHRAGRSSFIGVYLRRERRPQSWSFRFRRPASEIFRARFRLWAFHFQSISPICNARLCRIFLESGGCHLSGRILHSNGCVCTPRKLQEWGAGDCLASQLLTWFQFIEENVMASLSRLFLESSIRLETEKGHDWDLLSAILPVFLQRVRPDHLDGSDGARSGPSLEGGPGLGRVPLSWPLTLSRKSNDIRIF
jgi:hypothetical protein